MMKCFFNTWQIAWPWAWFENNKSRTWGPWVMDLPGLQRYTLPFGNKAPINYRYSVFRPKIHTKHTCVISTIFWDSQEKHTDITSVASSCTLSSSRDITEPWNHEGWKRPLQSPSPSPTHPTLPTDHVPKCHIPFMTPPPPWESVALHHHSF